MPISMHMSALPSTLLDLTFSPVFPRRSHVLTSGLTSRWMGALHTSRKMHQAALLTSPAPDPNEQLDAAYYRRQTSGRTRPKNGGSIAVRSGKEIMSSADELQRRVQALKEAVVAEESVSSTSSYSEDELLSIYEDLLALPHTTDDASKVATAPKSAQAEEDLAIVNAIDQRFFGSQLEQFDESILPLSKILRQRRIQTSGLAIDRADSTETCHTEAFPSTQPYLRVLQHVQTIIARVEAVRASLYPSEERVIPDSKVTEKEFLPVSVITRKEYESLIRVCIQAQDGEAAELALDLLKRSGVSLSENSITDVLELYADSGESIKAEQFLAKFLTRPPTERQRHLHVKAHLSATPPQNIPTSSLAVLHSYEAQSYPAPMTTYTLLITTLFSLPSSVARAQAWDLFTHMRYVAHPNPDALLYTLMIRACASPLSSSLSSDALRALDLWTEMTVDHKIMPTAGSYSAIILACARSGSKIYVNEAFRLAKEMLDSHRDARGISAFRPDRKTFCALLEGAKRVGDLARVRWILAEMVRGSRDELDENGVVDAEVTEEVMMHVFHAYAAYTPPFKRTDTLLRNENSGVVVQPQPQPQIPVTLGSDAKEGSPGTKTLESLSFEADEPAFLHIPPQSRSEIMAEAKVLFARILRDTGADTGDPNYDSVVSGDGKFKNVQLTTRLLNSYLSVYYKHSSLETSREMFKRLFEDVGVCRNARSYVEALERCAMSRRGHERVLALEFAEETWALWQTVENTARDDEEDGRRVSARMVERAHVAMIRILTLTDNIDRAISQVRAFIERYPAADIRKSTSKPALRSTRTVLVGARPLVRATSTVEVPDDNVPPLLTFGDLEVLHHRLVAGGRRDEIGFLKYVCKAYEGALRARRDGTMKAEPAEIDPVSIAV